MFSYDQITHKLTHTHTLLHNSFKFVIGLLSRFICLFHVQRVTAIRKYKSSKTILIVRSHLERNANIRYTKFCNSFSLFRSSLCNINNANSGRVETKHRFTCFQIHTHSPRKYLQRHLPSLHWRKMAFTHTHKHTDTDYTNTKMNGARVVRYV